MAGPKSPCSIHSRLESEIEEFNFDDLNNKQIAAAILAGSDIDTSELPGYGPFPFFPIEFLKRSGVVDSVFKHSGQDKTFLSSGTTQASRSQSKYSRDGLFLYKISAITSFKDTLKKTGIPADQFKGVSLIPPTSIWPDSSLAQMISWFGNYFDLTYLEEDVDERHLSRIIGQPSEPVWLFGTAFHYVNILDQLPDTSKNNTNLYTFETGGTKGKSRDITREELYKLINKKLGVPFDNLFSQYGMCELASQAWSSAKGEKVPWESPYTFPPHVSIKSTLGLNRLAPNGTGSLVVFDPARIDLNHPLRTQDIVDISADGSFSIHGRVAHSTLKGCSLLANDPLLQSDKHVANTPEDAPHTNRENSPQIDKSWCRKVFKRLEYLLEADNFKEALLNEFGSHVVANSALNDLKSSIPANEDEFYTAILASNPKHDSILIIHPNTHSFSSIYPLTFSVASTMKVSIRLPGEKNKFAPLRVLINELNKLIIENDLSKNIISTLDDSYRIGNTPVKEDCILAFGTDETISSFKRLTKKEVIAYGSTVSVSILSEDIDHIKMEKALKDFYSLNQLGCLSSRVLFIDKTKEKDALKLLEHFSKKIVTNPLDQCSIDHEEAFLWENQTKHIKRSDLWLPLFPIHYLDDTQQLSDLLYKRNFVLPVVFFKSREDIHKILDKESSTTHVSSDDDFPGTFPNINIGDLNCPKWDGTHEGRPLFERSI